MSKRAPKSVINKRRKRRWALKPAKLQVKKELRNAIRYVTTTDGPLKAGTTIAVVRKP